MMIMKMMKMKMILLHLDNHKNYDYVRGQNHDGINNFLNRCGRLFFF